MPVFREALSFTVRQIAELQPALRPDLPPEVGFPPAPAVAAAGRSTAAVDPERGATLRGRPAISDQTRFI